MQFLASLRSRTRARPALPGPRPTGPRPAVPLALACVIGGLTGLVGLGCDDGRRTVSPAMAGDAAATDRSPADAESTSAVDAGASDAGAVADAFGNDAVVGRDGAMTADDADVTRTDGGADSRDAGPAADASDGGTLPAPRPKAPLSSATVTSVRPTLAWELAGSTDGAEITLCRDRTMTSGCRTEVATGDRARLAGALSPGWWFWRLQARQTGSTGTSAGPVWQFWVGARDAPIDASWDTASDFNGDGFADVVVGAGGAGGGNGRVYVYDGSAAGVAATPSATLIGFAFGQLGGSVASAGDVNGDGFADLIAGASLADVAGRRFVGAVAVYLGSAAGLSTTPQRIVEGLGMQDQFGGSVSSAGDVNGDGYADVIIGAHAASPGGMSGAGTATIYHGSAAGISMTPAITLSGSGINTMFGFSGEQFGFSVSSAGDVNADGFADVVVGSRNGDPDGTASIFHGSPAGIVRVAARQLSGVATRGTFGNSVAGAGDVNGDGYADVVVAAFGEDVGGRAQVGTASIYLGSAAGIPASRAAVLEGTAARDFFGHAVASAGDVNGDGFSDVIVGSVDASPGGRAGAGYAKIFHGSANGVSTIAARTIEGVLAEDQLGSAVASPGDVNGDGFGDLAIGAGSASPGGRTRAGMAHVFHGSATGVAMSPATTFEGAAPNDYFGYAVE